MKNQDELKATDTEETESGAQTCPNCDKEQADWAGNRGQGYVADGEVYCCEGCAEGTGCTCEEEVGKETNASFPQKSKKSAGGTYQQRSRLR